MIDIRAVCKDNANAISLITIILHNDLQYI